MKKSTLVGTVLVAALSVGLLGTQSSAREKRQILIAGGRTTSPWYVFAQALAKFINDKSDWLSAEAVSTAGVTGNVDLCKEKPQEYIGLNTLSHIHYNPGHEWGEARGTYTGYRFIANANSSTQCFITYDPKLKTVKDLAGKVVDVGRKGAANTMDHKALLARYGVLDKVTLVYTGYGGGGDKMKDGLVDTTMQMFDHIYPRTFSKGGFIESGETRGPIYYIGFDKAVLEDLLDKEYATMPVWVPAKALDPVTQPEGFWAFGDPSYFMADERMDDDVVYEITRVIWETPPEEWTRWHPQGAHMTHKFEPAMPSLKHYKAHPGAKKFYDEKGVKLVDLATVLQE
jgi:TRAP transporter TAXI family solute receptor